MRFTKPHDEDKRAARFVAALNEEHGSMGMLSQWSGSSALAMIFEGVRQDGKTNLVTFDQSLKAP